jgi:hypothetical protein
MPEPANNSGAAAVCIGGRARRCGRFIAVLAQDIEDGYIQRSERALAD